MRPLFTNIIHRLLVRRHFWRHVGFPELAELYAARMLRSVALNMVSVFVAVLLYQSGYSVMFILGYFACYYAVRILAALPAAFMVARLGPKHVTFISNVIFVPALVALYYVPSGDLRLLALYATLQAFSITLFNISYNVDFAKVKHVDHVGKEIGFMQAMDRAGTALSPLAGGLIAYYFGPQVTIVVASIIFALAAVPLFFTPEPVPTRQRLTLRGIDWSGTFRPIFSNIGVGADITASTVMWPLFLIIFIFTSNDSSVYAEIGAVASVTVVAALISARIYGRLIDRARGGLLLRYSVVLTTGLHLVRVFINTPVAVVLFNIMSEVATTGYYMAYLKGFFDTSDRSENFRVVYISMCEAVAAIGALLLIGIAIATVSFTGIEMGMKLQFVGAALLSMLIAAHGYRTYARKPVFG